MDARTTLNQYPPTLSGDNVISPTLSADNVGVCNDSIFAFMVLCAQFPKI